MKPCMKLLTAVTFAFLSLTPSARALELGITGGMGNPRFTTAEVTGTAYTGRASPYAGVLLGFGMLETGLIYSTHVVSESTSTTSFDRTYTFADVPVMLRVGSGRLSLGFGFYYSKLLSAKFDTTTQSGLKHDNYGATANLRLRLLSSLSLDTRINLMLTDEASDSGNNTYFHIMQTGLTFFF